MGSTSGRFKGLEAFAEDYLEATPLLLYRGKERHQERGILCLPVEEFLLRVHPSYRCWEDLSVK